MACRRHWENPLSCAAVKIALVQKPGESIRCAGGVALLWAFLGLQRGDAVRAVRSSGQFTAGRLRFIAKLSFLLEERAGKRMSGTVRRHVTEM